MGDPVYQDLVTRAANNPCADTLLNLSVHCSVMARLAKGEGDIAAWAIYEREVCDWLDAYLKWGSTWVR